MVGLSRCLVESFRRFGSLPALTIADRAWTYDRLGAYATALIAGLPAEAAGAPRVGLLAERSIGAYAGVLAAAVAGWTYTPLSPAHPVGRLAALVERARLTVLIVDRARLGLAREVLAELARPVTVCLCADDLDHAQLDPLDGGHRLVVVPGPAAAPVRPVAPRGEERPLYLMFTSGTTGEPKGILIERRQVLAYLNAMAQQFDLGPDDRCSQFFRLTFDLSVHDLLVTWRHGACLYVPTEAELLDPVAFCRRHGLTSWFSVPSMAALARSIGKLKPGQLPSLRRVLFCGEALSWEVAAGMAQAAPNASISNLYGPTEATIAITRYDLPPGRVGPARDAFEAVPIGRLFDGHAALVVNEALVPVAPGEIGELLLAGVQVARGYLDDPRQTAERFVRIDAGDQPGRLWYRTGDLVEQHPDHGLIFRGRKDDQIKLRGHRIELAEVEAALRRAAETGLALVAAWPINELGVADELIAFVCRPHAPVPTISERLRAMLPPYMLPRRIISSATPYLSDNLKLDRKRFVRQLTQPGDTS
jgi:amino acid adenylation domain-containing protein